MLTCILCGCLLSGCALRCLAAPKRLRNKRIGEHQLCLRHIVEPQHNVTRSDIVGANVGAVTFNAHQHPAEPSPAGDRQPHFHL